MAKKKTIDNRNMGTINKLANNIQKMLNVSYMNNYYNSNANRNTLNDVHNGINNAINGILQQNNVNTGMSSLSALYTSLSKSDKNMEDNIKRLFEADGGMDNLINIYSENKYIRDMDNEIDTICTYMPQLEEALDILKENVLSSEQFNKEFLYINNISGADNKEFISNIEKMKNDYNLEELLDYAYYKTSKYGEVFYYVKPYSAAISDLLNAKDSDTRSLTVSEGKIIFENCTDSDVNIGLDSNEIKSINDFNVVLEHNMILNEARKSKEIYDSVMSMNNSELKKQFSKLSPDPKFTATDGVVDVEKVKGTKQHKIDVKGAIVKELHRENVYPIYIEDMCLGYLYIVNQDGELESLSKSASDPISGLKRTINNSNITNNEKVRDNAIKQIASSLAATIDATFINSNQSFKKEIYHILKYNAEHGGSLSNLKVTYIPPDDVFHFYFKKDPKTHRGISDLKRSIIPAKLYTSLYITNTLGIITRGYDKRVYYVKQAIDTNIASILLNTINEIKKGNFGMRDITNLNNFIGVTGRFNDMIIPEGPDGNPPIRPEIMQGQDIQIKTELMDMLENMAVSVTGVSLEAVQTRASQVDFATQITANNGKLLKRAYKRQTLTENMFSPFLTRIYNYQFGGNNMIELSLPAPKYLNNQQMDMTIENAMNTKDKYISLAYGDNRDDSIIDPKEIDLFAMDILRREYSGIIPWDKIDKAKDRAAIQYKALYGKKSEDDV